MVDTALYTGSETSKTKAKGADGTYYYRVRACRQTTCSDWSNTATVVIDREEDCPSPPEPKFPINTGVWVPPCPPDHILGFAATADSQTVITATSDEITYYYWDISGSPIAAANSQGVIIWREHYKPYGEKLNEPAGEDVGYTGHEYDAETGLTYMQARYYDAEVGRFLAIDPVGFKPNQPMTFNRYSYANNNPYKYVDPDGRDAVDIQFEGYDVHTGFGFTIPAGHAGVLLINEKTGFTKYYEYGRYSPSDSKVIGAKLPKMDGNVRNIEVPNVKIENGKPTQQSLQNVYKHLSEVAGDGNPVDADYYEDADFEKANTAANDIANNPARDDYSVLTNSCYSFADDVIEAGTVED